jgi:hypothetical protein
LPIVSSKKRGVESWTDRRVDGKNQFTTTDSVGEKNF